MKMYVAKIRSKYGLEAKIKEVEVERETECSVWIDGRRSAKDSEWATYFDTFEEARSSLFVNQSRYVDSLKLRHEAARVILGEIFKLEKP